MALALSLERQRDRVDLRIVVMSATLGGGEAERVAKLMGGCLDNKSDEGQHTEESAPTTPIASTSSPPASKEGSPVPIISSHGKSYPVGEATLACGETT